MNVLVPSARTVYGVERVQLVEEGSSEPGGQDAPAEAPVDDEARTPQEDIRRDGVLV